MHHRQNDLGRHFPDHAERIEALRLENEGFSELCEDFVRVNRAISRSATDAVFMGHARAEQLRRQRELLEKAIADSLDDPLGATLTRSLSQ